MKQIRVNLTTKASVRRETRDGREKLIVSSATLPFGVVMNGIKYPEDEIRASFMSLEGTPAPMGHPVVNGEYVPANSPRAIGFLSGVYNENVRIDGNRVMLDKVIDVEVTSKLHPQLLDAVNKGEPIHTSTGLLCNVDVCNDGDAEYVARNMVFDHDAILLNERGAATPEQGVGMLVNGEKIDVVNSEVSNDEIDYFGTELLRAIERKETATKWQQIKAALFEALGLGRETETDEDEEDSGMTDVTKEEFDALSAKVETLANALEKVDLAPLTEAVAALTANAKQAEEAEKAALVEAVANMGIAKEAAEGMDVAALKAVANAKLAPAAGVNAGAPVVNSTIKYGEDWN